MWRWPMAAHVLTRSTKSEPDGGWETGETYWRDTVDLALDNLNLPRCLSRRVGLPGLYARIIIASCADS